jgi:hypothetical protein
VHSALDSTQPTYLVLARYSAIGRVGLRPLRSKLGRRGNDLVITIIARSLALCFNTPDFSFLAFRKPVPNGRFPFRGETVQVCQETLMKKEISALLSLMIICCLMEAQTSADRFVPGTQGVAISSDAMAVATAVSRSSPANAIAAQLTIDSGGNATLRQQNRAQHIDSSPATIPHSSTVASASTGVTIHVPADQPTIQAGINAANNGDTVLVSDGTYNESINFSGKAAPSKV